MKCPNCGKKYHWCFSCGWDAGGAACSYMCAWELYQDEKISDADMLLWAFEEIHDLRDQLKPVKARAAKVVRSKK